MTKFHATLAALILSLAAPAVASAGHYGTYSYSATRGYGYRTYSYYSYSFKAYRTHVAVYHPKQPTFVYYYNPHSGRYWGRFNTETGKYQLLAEADRKPTLAEIDEKAFQPEGPMPTEEKDGESLLPPPEPTADAAKPQPATKPTSGSCHR